ncbi:MAG: arylesterase [Parvibaculaceae bacterium]|jgi:acyl-CoA thioesterase-1
MRRTLTTQAVSHRISLGLRLWAGISFLTAFLALFIASGAARAASLEIVALGDSLTAGYQLPPGAGFPEQLGRALAAKGYDVSVMNAGVSGDTSAGGLARLDWAVGPDTDALILELGSNDALRGIEPDVTRANLQTIIERMKQRGIKVLIAGMLAPPNMGDDYARDFNAIFPELAAEHDTLLYPFFLDGVAANPALNLPDGMHPTEEGVAVMVERILPTVEKLIAEADGSTAAIN